MDNKACLNITAIFLLALVLRLAFLGFYDTRSRKDAVSYDRIAVSLAAGKGYAWPDGTVTAARDPGYPFFLSLIYRMFGHDYAMVKIIQCLLGAAGCIFIYLAALEIFDKRTAFIAGLLSAVHIGFIAACRLFLSENLAIFLLAILLLCLANAFKRNSPILFSASGLLVGMLCLTKALIVLFVPVLAFMIIFARPHKPPGRRFLSAALIVLTAVMVVAPWSVRNFIVFKQFVPLTTHLGESFYAAYVPKDGKILGMFERDNPVHEYAVENLDEPHKSRFMFKQAVAFIKKNPKKVIKLLPLKMMFFFSPFDWEILAGQGVYSFSYMFIFPFFMLGLWHSRHKDDGIGLLRLLFFYFFFVSLLFYGSPRFRLPCEMVMIVFAAYAINRLFSKPSGFKRHILVLSAWAAANAALFIFSDNVKYLLKSILEVTGLW